MRLVQYSQRTPFITNAARFRAPLNAQSNIKTKTVLTVTDMTESTELRAFERQKDG